MIVRLQANVQPEHSRLHTEDHMLVVQWFWIWQQAGEGSRFPVSSVMDVDAWIIAVESIQKHGCIEYVEEKWSQNTALQGRI